MKSLAVAFTALVVTLSSYGQGQFVFVNRAVGFFDVPVFDLSGANLAELGVRVQLWTSDGSTMLAESTFRPAAPL